MSAQSVVCLTWLLLALAFAFGIAWVVSRDLLRQLSRFIARALPNEPHPSTWTESQFVAWCIR